MLDKLAGSQGILLHLSSNQRELACTTLCIGCVLRAHSHCRLGRLSLRLFRFDSRSVFLLSFCDLILGCTLQRAIRLMHHA